MVYSQPKFYHFSEDSIHLVKLIKLDQREQVHVLDVGAGCGVVGIELALRNSLASITFLEKEESFKPYLKENIEKFIPLIETDIVIKDIMQYKFERKFDLIISNPPYFDFGKGRISPENEKQNCRTFSSEMNLSRWIDLCMSFLNPEGSLYLVNRKENINQIKNTYDVLDENSKNIYLKLIYK